MSFINHLFPCVVFLPPRPDSVASAYVLFGATRFSRLPALPTHDILSMNKNAGLPRLPCSDSTHASHYAFPAFRPLCQSRRQSSAELPLSLNAPSTFGFSANIGQHSLYLYTLTLKDHFSCGAEKQGSSERRPLRYHSRSHHVPPLITSVRSGMTRDCEFFAFCWPVQRSSGE